LPPLRVFDVTLGVICPEISLHLPRRRGDGQDDTEYCRPVPGVLDYLGMSNRGYTRHSPLVTIVVVSTAISLRFIGSAAWGTTLRLIGKAFRLVELLFPGAECEGSSAIDTLDWLVLKTHWMTSSLLNFNWSSGHPTLWIIMSVFGEACNNLNRNCLHNIIYQGIPLCQVTTDCWDNNANFKIVSGGVRLSPTSTRNTHD